MSVFSRATVASVETVGEGFSRALLEFDGGERSPAVVLESLVGVVEPGDEVIANTTAVELGLGSGGFHFVLWNLSGAFRGTPSDGHIMKLRYTPLQFNVRAVEEEPGVADVPEDGLEGVLAGMPVIAGSLHSQLLAVAVAYRDARPGGRLAYVMTDGGALPIAFSDTARFLKEDGYICASITCGHAFGGDFEAVTVHGALAAAKRACGADAVVVLMGPGIVGTGSTLGFSGIEQASVANTALALGGRPFIVPRITFGDARERHRGVSHHTLAALRCIIGRAVVCVPRMEGGKAALVDGQLERVAGEKGHELRVVDARGVLGLIEGCGRIPTVMGRTPEEEPEFFMAAGGAGMLAARDGGGSA